MKNIEIIAIMQLFFFRHKIKKIQPNLVLFKGSIQVELVGQNILIVKLIINSIKNTFKKCSISLFIGLFSLISEVFCFI